MKFFISALLTFITISLWSQIDVVTNIYTPNSFVKYGNSIYIAETAGKISTFNLDSIGITNTPQSFLTDLTAPYSLNLIDDCLYFTNNGNIVKVNLGEVNPTIEIILDSIQASVISIHEEFLYFYDQDHSIYRVNLDEVNPTKELIITSEEEFSFVSDIEIYNNYLYILVLDKFKLHRIFLDEQYPELELVASNIQNPQRLQVYDGDLYSCHSNIDGNGLIIKWDTLSIPFSPSIILDNVGDVLSFLIDNNDIYVAKVNTTEIQDTIVKYCNYTVAVEELKKENFEIYPNPASDKINIKRNSNSNEIIYIVNLTGEILFKNSDNLLHTTIDINELENGIYFIGSKSTGIVPFIKNSN